MKTNKNILFSGLLAGVLVIGLSVGAAELYASEAIGTINTGLNSPTPTVTPTPTPTSTPTPTPTPTATPTPTPSDSGGGGGGGGGGGANNGNQGQVSGISTIKGDINKDGRVDVLDFNALVVNWGNNPQNINADLSGDGKVDILDFNALMVAWPH